MIAKSGVRIVVLVETPAWRKQKRAMALIRRAARAALAAKPKAAGELTIVLGNDVRLKDLNRRFRRKNKPTNVLSFPGAAGNGYLGDVAIAYGVVAREAKTQGKTFSAHAAHLAAHGVLHLLGYDHQKPSQAKRMEAVEIAILARLGLPDPYALAGTSA